MKLRIQKLHPDAQLPVFATEGAACFDLVAFTVMGAYTLGCHVDHGHPVECGTGLAFEIPPGHAMLIFSRSGHGFKHGMRLANCVGVIDSDYRGEVKVKLTQDLMPVMLGSDDFGPFIKPGDRIAQAMILPVPAVELELADTLTETQRGTGGFGSTGTASF